MIHPAIQEVARSITAAGFKVFIAEKGTYGYYTDERGSRVVSFQVDIVEVTFSGDYISKRCGTGWRIDPKDYNDFKRMLYAHAPQWATNGERVQYQTKEYHDRLYMHSSRYTEYTGGGTANAN